MKVYVSSLSNNLVSAGCPHAVAYYRAKEVDEMIEAVKDAYRIMLEVDKGGFTEGRKRDMMRLMKSAFGKSVKITGTRIK